MSYGLTAKAAIQFHPFPSSSSSARNSKNASSFHSDRDAVRIRIWHRNHSARISCLTGQNRVSISSYPDRIQDARASFSSLWVIIYLQQPKSPGSLSIFIIQTQVDKITMGTPLHHRCLFLTAACQIISAPNCQMSGSHRPSRPADTGYPWTARIYCRRLFPSIFSFPLPFSRQAGKEKFPSRQP